MELRLEVQITRARGALREKKKVLNLDPFLCSVSWSNIGSFTRNVQRLSTVQFPY